MFKEIKNKLSVLAKDLANKLEDKLDSMRSDNDSHTDSVPSRYDVIRETSGSLIHAGNIDEKVIEVTKLIRESKRAGVVFKSLDLNGLKIVVLTEDQALVNSIKNQFSEYDIQFMKKNELVDVVKRFGGFDKNIVPKGVFYRENVNKPLVDKLNDGLLSGDDLIELNIERIATDCKNSDIDVNSLTESDIIELAFGISLSGLIKDISGRIKQ